MTEKQLKEYQKTIEQGGGEQTVINRFLGQFIYKSVKKFKDTVKDLMRRVREIILSPDELKGIEIQITQASITHQRETIKSFSDFVNKVFSKKIFSDLGITSPVLKQTIKSNTLSIFKRVTADSLTRTNADILSTIRNYQKDLIVENLRIDKLAEIEKLTVSEIRRLRTLAKKKALDLNKTMNMMIDEDRFIMYRNGAMHNIDEYTEMATRTTLLNIDRTANEIKLNSMGRRVAEYYVRDPRAVKKPRKICKHIMKNQRLYGKPLVALDEEAAGILGIVTIQKAKTTWDKAMGVNCRHSIKDVGETFHKRIENVIYLSTREAV